MAFLPYKDYFGLSQIVLGSINHVSQPSFCGDDVLGITSEMLSNSNLEDWSTIHIELKNNGKDTNFYHGVVNVNQAYFPEKTYDGSSSSVNFLTNKKQTKRKKYVCVFCRNNGESMSVYQSHVLKDRLGRTACPILRRYTCPTCGASGDDAHTIRYCPLFDGGLMTDITLSKM